MRYKVYTKKKERTKEVRREFFLEWTDTKSRPSWQPEENVKSELIRQYYIKHTRAGKRRKHKPYKCFK